MLSQEQGSLHPLQKENTENSFKQEVLRRVEKRNRKDRAYTEQATGLT